MQVAAAKTEANALAMLRDPDIIAAQSPNVAALLVALRPHWRRMPRADRTAWVRRLLWSAAWKLKATRLALMFDEIGVERLLEDETLQVVDGLPVIP